MKEYSPNRKFKLKLLQILIIFVLIFNLTNNSTINSQDKPRRLNNYNQTSKKSYQYPKDTLVLQKLQWWQGLKFGLMMHWGTYSVNNIIESWTLCNEDFDWNTRRGPFGNNYYEYKKWYENAQKQFNPVLFNPNKFVNAAKYAGMRYVVFTTKHHDGFCMFRTNSTDYCVTDPKTPYSQDPRANITQEIFTAFRKNSFGIGAYYSKPDWHSNNYWWEYFATPDRNVNYETIKYPLRWNSFVRFTHSQLYELTYNFGNLDILWLDGAWVAPDNKNQDINMPSIVGMARQNQPGMLVVNRGCGDFEDYLTPEQEIPEIPPNSPWETCMTMGNYWSGVSGDTYKPTNKLIHNLIEIVAKGGNYLLNIGINSQGEWDTAAYNRLTEIGDWMGINNQAIYNTTSIFPYKESNICFTKKSDTIFVLYRVPNNQNTIPAVLKWKSILPTNTRNVFLLGYDEPLTYQIDNFGYVNVLIPVNLQNNPPCKHAYVLYFKNYTVVPVENTHLQIPIEFKLHSNFPNPFNLKTEIAFDVPKRERITITIFDVSGKEIVKVINNEYKNPGKYVIPFDGTNLSSGTYFCRMDSGDYSNTIRMVFLK